MRVLVILHEVLLVGVRVGVGLLVVAVLVLMLDVLVIVQNVRMRMRDIPVGMFVSVLCGHGSLRSWSYFSDEEPQINANLFGPRYSILHTLRGLASFFWVTQLNAAPLQVTKQPNCLSFLPGLEGDMDACAP
ncbi:MAG: hypothetical protein ACRDRT_15665 [Pseudonocardiaceae bacterium]